MLRFNSDTALFEGYNGTAWSSVGGQFGGRRNLIINGAMQVAQRGTSGTSSGYDSVDRFKVDYASGTVTQSQESLSSGAPFELGFHKFFRATNTSVATDTAAHFRTIRTILEDQDITNSGWNYKSSNSYITLSFWVRSSVSQEFYAHLNQGTDQYNYAFSIGTLSANTWTKVTKTISGNSNLSFNNDNSGGIEINIVPFWGTNFTTSGSTTDSWYSWNGSSRVPDMASTWATTSGATFDITGVQLEVGDTATPFEHRSYGEELALCQRYYQQFDPFVSTQGAGHTTTQGGNTAKKFYVLPTTMRSDPSISFSSNFQYYDGSTWNTNSTSGSGDKFGLQIRIDVGSNGGAPEGSTAWHLRSQGENVQLDAEL